MLKGRNNMKGFAQALLVFAIIIIAEVLIFAFAFGETITRQRHSAEYKILFEGDRLETYAHSLLKGSDLSLIQSVYDVGKNNVVYDSSLKYYSDGIPYWQIYDKSFIPTSDTFQEKVSLISHSYVNDYIDGIKTFATNDEYDISITKVSKDFAAKIDQDRIAISSQSGDEVNFTRKTPVDNKDLKIERAILVDSSVSIHFEEAVNKANGIIKDQLIRDQIRDIKDQDKAQEELNKLGDSLSNDDLLVKFIVKSFQSNPDGKFKAVVLVEISDKSNDYPVYSYSEGKVILDKLGLKFYAKIGTMEDNDDEHSSQDLSNLVECSNNIEVISTIQAETICNQLNNFS